MSDNVILFPGRLRTPRGILHGCKLHEDYFALLDSLSEEDRLRTQHWGKRPILRDETENGTMVRMFDWSPRRRMTFNSEHVEIESHHVPPSRSTAQNSKETA